MNEIDPEARRRRERARQEGIWRYLTIQDAAGPALTGRQRGAVVRRIVAETAADGFGNPRRVSRPTVERWLRAYRSGGLAALTPAPRQVTPRTDPQVLEQAAALKAQVPARTAEQVRRILLTTCGWSPSAKTLQRHFRRLELAGPGGGPAAFGTFEAAGPNDLWTGDGLHGPVIEGRKCYLFCFIDDHSRAVMAACWGRSEGIVALSRALRPALAARAVPSRIFVDNGSAFCDAALVRACACLGIKITHSTPYRPQGKGKIERFFETVRGQFLVEAAAFPDLTLAQLNSRFTAWVEQRYHHTVHSSTGVTPLQRWMAAAPYPTASPAQLAEAFRWEETRKVRKNATVSLFGVSYCVPGHLAGATVQLVFDPFDLGVLDVRRGGQPQGLAVPLVIGPHVHPKAAAAARADDPPPPPAIDYLAAVEEEYRAATRRRINYAALTGPAAGDGTAGSGGDQDSRDQDSREEMP